MRNDTQQIGISIPEQLIHDLVSAAIIRELGSTEEIVSAVVKSALSVKDHHYDNETIFQRTVHKMIRQVAEQCLGEWVEQNREKIKAAFIDYLNSGDGAATKKLAEGMVNGLSRYSVSVAFNWKTGDYGVDEED